MQKGFDVDIRRKQWVLDTGISRRDEVFLDLEPPPPPGLLSAAHRLQGAFCGAISVPSKTRTPPPQQPPPPPPVFAHAEPAAETRGLPGRRILYAYVAGCGLMVLVTPAFVNHGTGAPLAVVCCVAPLLLPVITMHLLLQVLDGLRLAPACGAMALTACVPLAVLLAHGLGVAQCHWGVHFCVLALSLAFTSSLPGAAVFASVSALAVATLGAVAVELGKNGGPEVPTTAFAVEIATCASLGIWSVSQYQYRVIGFLAA